MLCCRLQEIDALCEEWQPAPLVPDISDEDQRPDPPVISRWASTPYVQHASNHASAPHTGSSSSSQRAPAPGS